MKHEQSAKAALETNDLRRASILVGAGTDPVRPDSPIPNLGSCEIQVSDEGGVLPHFPSPSLGAAGTAPHGARRLHVDAVEPVAGRSEADDLRVCFHESSHATIGRHWSELGGVTCQPGSGYSGLCWGRAYDRHARFAETDDAPSLCEKIGPLMPAIGESRSSVADIYLHAFNRIVELVAGTEGEKLFLPGEPWFAHDDERQAISYALMITSSPASADALISACRIEAAALLVASAHIVRALALQLQCDRTMDAAAIDACIERAVAQRALAEERARRADWARVQQSAADFAARGLES